MEKLLRRLMGEEEVLRAERYLWYVDGLIRILECVRAGTIGKVVSPFQIVGDFILDRK